MSKILDEENLTFDFTAYDTVEKFDVKKTNPHGMKVVDFLAETNDCLYFIEVKDFQHPNAPPYRRKEDFLMLTDKNSKEYAEFPLKMGGKIKDSLLRKYAEGYSFQKRVMYLFLFNMKQLGKKELGMLKGRISNCVPTGLNGNIRFCAFTEISFDLVNVDLAQAGQSQKENDIIVQRIL